jgi:hypothetical protein
MQLGGSGNMFDDFPQKPKGMHRRTYTVNDMCRPPKNQDRQRQQSKRDAYGQRVGVLGFVGRQRPEFPSFIGVKQSADEILRN